jgi:predicted RNA-binding protein with PUA-like domain
MPLITYGENVTRCPMTRRYWLLKSDPGTFGWSDLEKARGRRTVWDGVRNYQARNILRDDVRRGDGVFFYHSQSDKAIIGTCRVTKAGYPDPADDAWTVIEIALDEKFPAPVTLEAMRAVPALFKMALLQRGSRLSVQPVKEAEWAIVLKMGRG